MNYLFILPFIISFFLGLLIIILSDNIDRRFNLIDKISLSWGIGLGTSSLITFSSFMLLSRLNIYFILLFHIILFSFLIFQIRKNRINTFHYLRDLSGLNAQDAVAVILILLASTPLWLKSSFYIHGGWDAWQVWNFKAKFLFLGANEWKNMFDPVLWRSSPHYPLLLPCMTVWGWLFTGTTQTIIPQFIAISFTLNTIYFLYSSLRKSCAFVISTLTCIAILTLPLFSILSISQYSDLTFSFYLLVTGVLIIQAIKSSSMRLIFLAGLNCGFMSFAKSEGLVSSFLIAALLIIFIKIILSEKLPKHFLFSFFGGYLLTAWSAFSFKLFLSSKNISFTNGFFSSDHPSTLARLKTTLFLWFLEIGTPLTTALKKPLSIATVEWNGLWIACLIGLILGGRNILNKKTGLIPAFLILYFAIILIYYQMNTYFEISWWMSTTLNRILCAVLPLALYWIILTVSSGKKN